jgi:hypothetical protein
MVSILNKKELINMSKPTNNTILELISNKMSLVTAYKIERQIPKYIWVEALQQLSMADKHVRNNEHSLAYASMVAFQKVYTNYANGDYTSRKPSVNKYYWDELSGQQIKMLISVICNNVTLFDEIEVGVRFIDYDRKFEVTKEVA